MKIENKKDTVANIDGAQKCQIAVNGKMFSMLSEKLYSNSIKAVVRELSCNAVDAHRDAGNREAFNVNLPTVIAPTFEVQDFGIGMSKDQIITLYNTYGASTKEESNEVIGGFGIGSKSPFAYTDQFTVESIKDGKKVTAMNWLSEDRVPVFKILSEIDTDEHNGTKISVPVRPDDTHMFIKSAVDVYLFLDMMPNIIQGRSVFYDSVNLKGNEEKFERLRQNPSIITPRTRLVMGGVEYLIDYDDIVRECFPEADYSTISALRRYFHNRQFSAQIGDISIPPSRETIIFDQRTVGFFRQFLLSNLKAVAEKPLAEDDFAGLMTIVEKYPEEVELIYRLSHDFSDLNTYFHLDDETKKRLQKINFLRSTRDSELHNIRTLTLKTDKNRLIEDADKTIYKGSINNSLYFKLQNVADYIQYYVLTVVPTETFDKLGSGLNDYGRYVKRRLNKDTIKVINAYDRSVLAVTPSGLTTIQKYLPNTKAIKWEDLERKEYKIKRAPREKKQKNTKVTFSTVRSINIESGHKVFSAYTLDELIKAAGKQIQIVYTLMRENGSCIIPKEMDKKDITLDKLKYIRMGSYYSFHSELEAIRFITKKKIMIIQLDYVDVKRNELYKSIKNLDDFLKDLGKSRGFQQKLEELQKKYANYQNLNYLKEFFEILVEDNSNLLFKSVLNIIKEGHENARNWDRLCDLFQNKLDEVDESNLLSTQIFKKYPLLSYCPRYGHSNKTSEVYQDFSKYVELIDRTC